MVELTTRLTRTASPDFESAFAWSLEIQEPMLRKPTIEAVAKQWHANAPEQAVQSLQESQLPADTLKEILSTLNP